MFVTHTFMECERLSLRLVTLNSEVRSVWKYQEGDRCLCIGRKIMES